MLCVSYSRVTLSIVSARKQKAKKKLVVAASKKSSTPSASSAAAAITTQPTIEPAEKRTPLAHQWQPGQSGNPNGGRRWATVHHEIKLCSLEIDKRTISKEHPNGKTKLRRAVEKMIDMAIAGNIEAMKVWFERLDGKVAQIVAVQGDVTHTFVSTDDSDAERIMRAYLARSASLNADRRLESAGVESEPGLRIAQTESGSAPS